MQIGILAESVVTLNSKARSNGIKASSSKLADNVSSKKKHKEKNSTARFYPIISYSITLLLVFLFIYSQFNFMHMGCAAYDTLSMAQMPVYCRLSVANSTIYLSLLFPSIVFSYLLARKKSLKAIIEGLGLSASKLTFNNIGIGVLLFASILLLSFAMSIFSALSNIPLPTNVQSLLGGMPLYLLIFSFIIAPIDEEILFRGFLVPRIGIVLSALVFALLHFSYLSISETFAAFVFGLLAGYVFKKTGSLYATIIGHMLVNLLTIIAILALSGV
ncbi:MAG: CPBP family intramembrane glutamic endopeptidase [Candidatus Micrarchaeia archaeon]